jgi:hypothetical protein
MFMFVSLMFQAIAMVISLTIRLAYWTFKATIMLITATPGAISTSRRRNHFTVDGLAGVPSMRRHACVTLFVTVSAAIGSMMLAACSSSGQPSLTAATPAPPAAPTAKAPLKCDDSITSHHPAKYTTVGVRVRTAPHARITAVASYRLSTVTHRRRADGSGRRTLRYQARAAKRGFRVAVDVTTSRHGRKGYCKTWFRSPKLPHVTAPARAPSAPASSAPAPSPPPSAASCYPLSNEGTCYEPGEFCRDSDHGVTGVAGDGEKITCKDNDGWRWEPV